MQQIPPDKIGARRYEPTMWQGLMEHATGDLFAEIDREIPATFERPINNVIAGAKEQIRKAYIAGLAHGFQQGVEAEAVRAVRASLNPERHDV